VLPILVAAFLLYFPYAWCYFRKEPLSDYGLLWIASPRALRESVLLIVLTLIPLTPVAIHWPGAHVPHFFPPRETVSLLASGIAAAIIEETFFRGWLQTLVSRFLNPVLSIVLVSFVFAASHMFVTPGPLRLATFFPGLVMGYLRFRHGTVLPGVVYHALGNVWSVWFFPLP
jgi:membrane protease YdiL (CAAX protease family)